MERWKDDIDSELSQHQFLARTAAEKAERRSSLASKDPRLQDLARKKMVLRDASFPENQKSLDIDRCAKRSLREAESMQIEDAMDESSTGAPGVRKGVTGYPGTFQIPAPSPRLI